MSFWEILLYCRALQGACLAFSFFPSYFSLLPNSLAEFSLGLVLRVENREKEHSHTKWGQLQSKDRVLSVAHLPLLIHSSMGCFWKTFVFVFWDFHQQRPWAAIRVTWQISSLADWFWLSFFRSRLQTGCSSLVPFATQCSWTESLSSYLPLPPAGPIGSYILAYSQRGNSNLSLVQLSPFSFSFSPMLVLTFILFLMFTYWLVPVKPHHLAWGEWDTFTWGIGAAGEMPQHSNYLFKEIVSLSSNSLLSLSSNTYPFYRTKLEDC